jgi:hypothetical protein
MMIHQRCESCGKPLGRNRYRRCWCDEKCYEIRFEVISMPDGPSLRRFSLHYVTASQNRMLQSRPRKAV